MSRIVSKKLRDSARGQDCTLRLPGVCSFDSQTTVLAHLPCGQKGMGMKGPDMIAVFACSACHDRLDSRTAAAPAVTGADLLRALAETQLIWIRMGLLTVKGAA
ncbi:MAG: nuclease domain-containing protein [Thiobacillus sp.]